MERLKIYNFFYHTYKDEWIYVKLIIECTSVNVQFTVKFTYPDLSGVSLSKEYT